MRGNKFEKLPIHILEPETLSRYSRVTESEQEIVGSIPYNCELYTYFYHMSTLIHFWSRGKIYKNRGLYWRVSDCEELVGVSHRG